MLRVYVTYASGGLDLAEQERRVDGFVDLLRRTSTLMLVQCDMYLLRASCILAVVCVYVMRMYVFLQIGNICLLAAFVATLPCTTVQKYEYSPLKPLELVILSSSSFHHPPSSSSKFSRLDITQPVVWRNPEKNDLMF